MFLSNGAKEHMNRLNRLNWFKELRTFELIHRLIEHRTELTLMMLLLLKVKLEIILKWVMRQGRH